MTVAKIQPSNSVYIYIQTDIYFSKTHFVLALASYT